MCVAFRVWGLGFRVWGLGCRVFELKLYKDSGTRILVGSSASV